MVLQVKKEFLNKVFICKKEAKETLYWLDLIANAIDGEDLKGECRELWLEAKELMLIFGKIAGSPRVVA